MKIRRSERAPSPISHCAQAALVALGIWAGAVVDTAQAGPGGEKVMRGNVTFERIGNKTIIRASNGSIINFDQFNIAGNETVKFIQPSQLARVLNRITNGEPTIIQGKLLANGQVYIVNPAGVMFGQGAVVDVGGIIAAAGSITDQRFIDGIDKFTGLNGAVTNDGSITAKNINLFGSSVANHGSLHAHKGVIAMVAGDTVHIKRIGDRISLKVDGTVLTDQSRPQHGTGTPSQLGSPGIENTGVVKSSRGQIVLGAGDMYSLAVRNSGKILAAKGEITVAAKDGLIENTSAGRIQADVNTGKAGEITIQGPSLLNAGRITANSNEGKGGKIEFTSQKHTFMAAGSHIAAEGLSGNADGGKIIINSYNGQTILAEGAKVNVSGGREGGDGGFVEVSGDHLVFEGEAKLSAKSGYEDGTLLLDPHNITIANTGGNDSLLDGGIIEFYEPNTNADVVISDEALEAIVGHIILQATGSILVNKQVDLTHNNDLTLEAWNTIHLNESINGINNLVMIGDSDLSGQGDIFLNKPLGIAGNASFDAVTTYLNSDTLAQDSGGSQHYFGPVILCRDMNLTSPDVHFFDKVDAFHAGEEFLVVNGPVVFNSSVGVFKQLEHLRVNGPSTLDGGVVITKNYQKYMGPATLTEDNTLISNCTGDIKFADTLNGQYTLEAQTAGATKFLGTVGGQGDLDSVTTDAPGTVFIAADMNGALLDFGDPATLGNNVTLKGTSAVIFNQTLDGDAHSAIVQSPYTLFQGNVTEMDLLNTDADGLTEIGENVTGNKLDFDDVVVVLGNSTITGYEFVDFDQTLDAADFGEVEEGIAGTVGGGFNITVNSDNLVRFGGDVGGNKAPDSLTVNVAPADVVDRNLIIIDGNLIKAFGDILLNQGGRLTPAEVATIAARNFGGIKIQSVNGHIVMGPNEKFTSLGNMKLVAKNGSMTLGDLNVFGNLTVDSPTIFLRKREGGNILNSEGEIINDGRASYIVFGTAKSINPNADIQLIGDGQTPIFASKVLANIQGPLGNFLKGLFASLQQTNFTFGGTVLDLTPPAAGSPPPPPPPPHNPPSNPPQRPDTLTQALSDGPTKIQDRVPRDPLALRPMERLAIFVRQMNNDELIGTVSGRQFSNDTPDSMGAPADQRRIAVNRLRRGSVLKSLEQHTAMFMKAIPVEDTGELMQQDQTPFIREALSKAWKSYLDGQAAAEASGELDPAKFRAFLAAQPDQAEALAYVDGLQGMFKEMWVMGVTRLELRNSLRSVLNPIVPEGMQVEQFEQALELNAIGS